MKKHSTANILLMELLVVILFFMLCVSTLVEVLGLARGKSAFARAQNDAMLKVENLESVIRESGGTADTLKDSGFAEKGDGWTLTEETFILHAVIAEEEGLFTMDDVIRGVREKMIRRHPHVFGEEKIGTSGAVLNRWEEIKKQEKAGKEWTEAYLPEAFREAEKLIDVARRRKEKSRGERKEEQNASV